MGSSICGIGFDVQDLTKVSRFWAGLLDLEIADEDEDEVALKPRDGAGPDLIFASVPEGKVVKNRVHLDLNPTDQAAEVERAKSLGATEVDLGQKDVGWVVMADPEGNEFCILTSR